MCVNVIPKLLFLEIISLSSTFLNNSFREVDIVYRAVFQDIRI
jgi:hypothetical protein